MAGNLAAGYASYVLTSDRGLGGGEVVAWLGSLVSNTAGILLFVVLLLVFPTGRLPSARARVLVGAGVVGAALWGIGLALEPGPLQNYRIENPFGAYGPLGVAAQVAGRVGLLILFGAIGGALASMVLRYRRASERERQQLKWFAFGAIVGTGVGLLFVFARALVPTSPAGEVLLVLTFISFTLIPISVTIAIVRHQLFDIDELISATVVYAALTAILAGIYTAAIRLFNGVFVALTGQSSEAALVLTTLLLAPSFTPIKQRLEEVVESRYKRDEAPAAPTTLEEAELEERIRRVVGEELARDHTRA